MSSDNRDNDASRSFGSRPELREVSLQYEQPSSAWAPPQSGADNAIGDYELLDEIGQGAFGKVYRARHKKLNKEVALKIIHKRLITDATVKKRFEQEALAASNLTHANLAAVYEHGQDTDGSPYLVMDLLDGTTLAQLLKEKSSIKPERALLILIQICEALDHAHRKGIVHRDVKPSNIIISGADDGLDLVKLVDFGIAKVWTMPAVDTSRITQTAQVLGSPAYMSPEQCLGAKIDARSDVYSVGCLIYEILTGVPPLLGTNPIQTVIRHVKEDAPSIVSTDKDSLVKYLGKIADRALKREPSDRYQSIAELLLDLYKLRSGAGEPTEEQRPARLNIPLSFVALAAVACLIVVTARQFLGPTASLPFVPGTTTTRFTTKDLHGRILFTTTATDMKAALREAIAQRVNFQDADLTRLDLGVNSHDAEKEKNGQDLVFQSVDLRGASFAGSDLRNVVFSQCDLSGADFTGTTIGSYKDTHGGKVLPVLFDRCSLKKAAFIGTVSAANFRFLGCDLSDATIDGSSFYRCSFCECNFQQSSIIKSTLEASEFKRCRFDYVNLSQSNLRYCVFEGTSLTGTNINDARHDNIKFL